MGWFMLLMFTGVISGLYLENVPLVEISGGGFIVSTLLFLIKDEINDRKDE